MKFRLLLLFFLLFSFPVFASHQIENKELNNRPIKTNRWYLEDIRFGGGVGYGLYLTNQMDYKITTNYGDFNELIPSYYGAIYKVINEDFEMGMHYRHGHLLTLKSENTQGSTCDFDEGQFNIAYSFNHNAGLTNGNFTAMGQIGLGMTYFRSKYFTVDTDSKTIDEVYSTVGYKGTITSARDQANKQPAVIGNFGLLLGLRLGNNLSVFWENTVNISTSNKMSGNLHKKSWIPPDSYFYSSLGIYINLKPSRNRLGCPKF